MTTCQLPKDLTRKSFAVWEELASKYCISEEPHKDIFNDTLVVEQESVTTDTTQNSDGNN
jgi:hypothetical protein